jgi:hypothetical protein
MSAMKSAAGLTMGQALGGELRVRTLRRAGVTHPSGVHSAHLETICRRPVMNNRSGRAALLNVRVDLEPARPELELLARP